jgi:hypothetical protein
MLDPRQTGTPAEGHVAVDLLLQMTRGADNRLSGTVRTVSGTESRSFSGTLELMRVFEEFVPAPGDAPDRAHADIRERTRSTDQPTRD